MDERLREQLLGYALGALDETEQRELAQRLTVDPELRRQLECVLRSLEPFPESVVEYDPPSELASRACLYVKSEAERLNRTKPGLSRATSGCNAASPWALADWVVLGGICAAAVLLFFPAVLNSRFMSRVDLCKDNLRQLGTSLVQYSEYIGDGFFPSVPTQGNRAFAGIYSPTLREVGLLQDERRVVCPDTELAMNQQPFRIPTVSEIDAACGKQIVILQQFAGGSYAYSLGVILNGRHMPARNLGRAHFALMADAPGNAWGQPVHQHGQNILYEDLHISFVIDGDHVQLNDNPFCNRNGRCEAGVDANDAVVAPSGVSPIGANSPLSVSEFH